MIVVISTSSTSNVQTVCNTEYKGLSQFAKKLCIRMTICSMTRIQVNSLCLCVHYNTTNKIYPSVQYMQSEVYKYQFNIFLKL